MSISMKAAQFVNVRTAGEITFIPAHILGGKRISSKAVISAYYNSNKGADGKGTHESYKFVVWGKLAETCCKVLSKGSEFSVFTTPNSFAGRVFTPEGLQKLGSDGQPVMTNKVSFTVTDISFGQESSMLIANEIATGRRPMNWDTDGHPDQATWKAVLKQKHATPWDFASKTWFNARVSVPMGAQLDYERLNLSIKAPVQNASMPVQVANAVAGAVHQMYNQAPVQQPMYNQAPVQQPVYQNPATQYQQLVNAPQFHGQPVAQAPMPQAPKPNYVPQNTQNIAF